MQRSTKWVILLIATVNLAVGGVQPVQPTTAQAATYVYVTRTGKHYFYHRHNRGLNRAKKVYRVNGSASRINVGSNRLQDDHTQAKTGHL